MQKEEDGKDDNLENSNKAKLKEQTQIEEALISSQGKIINFFRNQINLYILCFQPIFLQKSKY